MISNELAVAMLGVVAAAIGLLTAYIARIKRHEVKIYTAGDGEAVQKQHSVMIAEVVSRDVARTEKLPLSTSKNPIQKVPLAELLIGEWKAEDKNQEIRSLILERAGRYTMTYINALRGISTESGSYTLVGHIVAIASPYSRNAVLRLEVDATGEGIISAEPTSCGHDAYIYQKDRGSMTGADWIQWSTQRFIRV